MWPVIVGGALAAGGAIGNWMAGKENAEALSDAYDRISGMSNRAVADNQGDIDAYKALVAQQYGNGNNAYQEALNKFLNSDVYQNEGFSYDGNIDSFIDPALNQRLMATENAMNNAAASGGNRFSSDYMNNLTSRIATQSSEEWEKAYQRLMQDRQTQLNEYNANSQNAWNNYNAQQNQLKAAVDAYGADRDKYYEGMGNAMSAGVQNRLGGLNTLAQTTMGNANAQQGTGNAALFSNLMNAGSSFMGNYFGGK